MSWVAVAVGLGTAAVGGVQANQERQRSKGVIGKAFGIASERLKLRQGDVRQDTGESLGARGLTQGGGGRDLAAGTMTSLGKEQGLETADLNARKDSELSTVNANANAGIVGSVVRGIGTGVDLGNALHPGAEANRYPGSFGGVDPVDPLGRGAWKSPGSTSGFNMFNKGNEEPD